MSRFKLDQIARNFDKLKRDLPPVIGNMGQRFFRENFDKQGFVDNSFNPWKARKGEIRGGLAMAAKSSKGSRALLVKSGHLRNAVNRSLKTAEFDNISFVVPLKYAAVHNYGFSGIQYIQPHKRTASRGAVIGDFARKGSRVDGSTHNVSGFSRRMNIPQRKFMGNSTVFIQQIDERVLRAMRLLHS
jgi:phage gpG-like protein